jgi:insulysin
MQTPLKARVEDGHGVMDNQSIREVEVLADHLEAPSLDDRSYRVIRLSNKLEALLVHDPETDQASAAMDVNVGNYSDPEDMPGMAHAVEHLLFMGTEKVSLLVKRIQC